MVIPVTGTKMLGNEKPLPNALPRPAVMLYNDENSG